MRSTSALALVVGLCVAGVRPVHAGDFEAPFTSNACGRISIATDAMQDPSGAFTSAVTPELCQKLCDRSGKLCKVYVKDVLGCYFRLYANAHTFGKLNCASFWEDPTDLKQCKQDWKDYVGEVNEELKGLRAESLQGCEDWRATCRASCGP